jgi:hypothetical protein
MSQIPGGYYYTVQQGDTLSGITQQAYGDQSLEQEIYNFNTQVIGNNPNLINPGMKLFIPSNPQEARVYLTAQSCTVTVASLHVRNRPCAESTIAASYSQGTVLNFIEVIISEMVDGNSYWGHSMQGHYFWLGGTNRPQG